MPLEDVIKKGTGREAQLDSDMAAAGKTGTTSNNYDYWFCGYTLTTQLLCGPGTTTILRLIMIKIIIK